MGDGIAVGAGKRATEAVVGVGWGMGDMLQAVTAVITTNSTKKMVSLCDA